MALSAARVGVMVVREWVGAAVELTAGIFIRFYLWVIPLVLLQPIDLLEKVGINLVIPDWVVYLLVALGVFVSAVDIVRGKRSDLAKSSAREDARMVAGMVEMAPVLIVEDLTYSDEGNPIGITFLAAVHIVNRSGGALRYRVQRFDARVEGHIQPSGVGHASFPIPPGDYMQARGPNGFGPHAIGGFIDGEFVVEIRIARPFATTTVIEQRRLQFFCQVYDDGPGGNRGVHMGDWSGEAGPETYVRANIDDPNADWGIVGELMPPAPTGGPMRTVAKLQPGQTSNDAFGFPPGTLPPDPYQPEKPQKATRQQRRAVARRARTGKPDPRDEYQDGK